MMNRLRRRETALLFNLNLLASRRDRGFKCVLGAAVFSTGLLDFSKSATTAAHPFELPMVFTEQLNSKTSPGNEWLRTPSGVGYFPPYSYSNCIRGYSHNSLFAEDRPRARCRFERRSGTNDIQSTGPCSTWTNSFASQFLLVCSSPLETSKKALMESSKQSNAWGA